MRFYIALIAVLILTLSCKNVSKEKKEIEKPNILWITIEDWSPDLSCYGTKGIHTPNIDKLASEGVRYTNAFATSPVCSTSRSAMMTGFHQNYIKANQHRTYVKKALPYGIKPIPKIFEEAGYFTTLLSWKTDVNFLPTKRHELFMDATDWVKTKSPGWRKRKPNQPFFARITFQRTHRSWSRDSIRPINAKDIELPPYYANTDFIKRDWANGLEQMQIVDRQVGELLKKLKDDGLSENTIVVFISDHGRCHIRGKQFLYDGGIKIPMIVKWKDKLSAGTINSNMVMSIDICATILEAAKIKVLVPLHGKSLLSNEVKDRKYIFAARDKMDETHDAMRAIRSKKYKLIHNLMPERPYLQYNNYKEGAYPVLAEMSYLYLKGSLTPEQAQFFAANKPEFELFDLENDPYELNNLATDSHYSLVKKELLGELNNWRKNVIKDTGVTDEFRAKNIFPKKCPTNTVDEWVYKNGANFDFNKYGWPAWYPTRTLEEWKKARDAWVPYVYRKSFKKETRPRITL
jgi:arylsulfatase A-like enzyme